MILFLSAHAWISCYDFQAIFDWVDIAGIKLASMSPVGTDLETVKQQTEELKVWTSYLFICISIRLNFPALFSAFLRSPDWEAIFIFNFQFFKKMHLYENFK